MASVYLRRNQYWMKFRLPGGAEPIRSSLGTSDLARARLMCQKVELLIELLRPELIGIELPDHVRSLFGHQPAPTVTPAVTAIEAETTPVPPTGLAAGMPIEAVLTEYLGYIREENAPAHVANKLTHLRRYFGARLLGMADSDDVGVFKGSRLSQVTAASVGTMIDALPVSKKTKRHYRETFHGLLEFALKRGLHETTNFRYPNPMAALPSYTEKNKRIVFLDKTAVDHLLEILKPYPSVRMGVAIMIYAGLRRAEMLWLTRQSIADGLRYFSVINKRDEEKDLDSSLKTGERSVPILPELKVILEEYLPKLQGDWLVPSPMGRLWIGENFGDKHREVLRNNGLTHTCLHYRHTFATDRAREGWSLLRIATAMGNSVAVCERYYTAFIDPLINP